MEARYAKKYDLLLEKYLEIEASNEKLQNRICHVRKQIRYLRRLKRLLIQKLVLYGDRFMDVCLEIPDMEPGANVEDQIIRRVAEAPRAPTPPQSQPSSSSRGSNVNMTVANALNSTVGSSTTAPVPAKKRRRMTTVQDETALNANMASFGEQPAPPNLVRQTSHQQRKSIAALSSSSGASTPPTLLRGRRESLDGHHSTASSASTTPGGQQYHQVSASVEDVVNSVVFDCQRDRRNKEANEKAAKDEVMVHESISVTESDQAMVIQQHPSAIVVHDIDTAPVAEENMESDVRDSSGMSGMMPVHD